jgi:hypothetical protein
MVRSAIWTRFEVIKPNGLIVIEDHVEAHGAEYFSANKGAGKSRDPWARRRIQLYPTRRSCGPVEKRRYDQ